MSMQLLIGVGDLEAVPGPEAVADANGVLFFKAVTVPTGALTLSVRGQNECREIRSSRDLFVFDDAGDVECRMAFPGASEPMDGQRIYEADADLEPGVEGFQAQLRVIAGRPGVDTELLVLPQLGGEELLLMAGTDTGGSADFDVTLEPGEYAVRAICRWDMIEVPRLSATHALVVRAPPLP